MFIPLHRGLVTVIAGPSGGGKSIAVKALAGLNPPELAARIHTDPGLRHLKVTLLPQGLDENFHDSLSCGDYLELLGISEERVDAELRCVGLREADLRAGAGSWKYGRELNGGTAQKLALALALRRHPDVLILDETIAALDDNAATQVGCTLRQAIAQNPRLAVIVVNHRPDWTRRFADEVVFVAEGTTVWQGTNEDFWSPNASPGPCARTDYIHAVHALEGASPHPATRLRDPVLRVRDVRLAYGNLSSITFEVRTAEIVAIAAENGAGKTTLLRTLAGQLAPKEGTIEFPGRERESTRPIQQDLRLCAQNPLKSLNPFLRVRRLLRHSAARLGLSRGASRFNVEKMIADVCRCAGLDSRNLDKTIAELSGGQRARAGLARTLLGFPRILLLDEPTAGLDPEVVVNVLDAIRGLADDAGLAILLVAHDAEHRRYLGARTIDLRKAD